MNFSFFKWIGLGLIAYLIFLVSTLPASQVAARITLPNNLALSGVSGTIWNGSAKSIRWSGTTVYNVKWQLGVFPLLLGNIALDINAGDRRSADAIAVNGYIVLSRSSISAQGLQAYIPTDIVMANLAVPLPVNASGRFKVDIDSLTYPQSCEQLVGSGQWLNAGVAGTNGNIPLGQFSADLSCQDQKIAIKVKPSNQLGLDVTALVSHAGDISAKGKFKVDPSLPQEVHVAASLFGDKDNQGFYAIDL